MRTNVIDFNDARPQGYFAAGQLADPHYVRDLKERAANHYRSILTHLWPNGKFVGQEFEVGDVNGAPGRSLKISCRRDKLGVGCDFAGNVVVGDIIDCFAYGTRGRKASGGDFGAICEEIELFLGAPFKPQPAPQEKAKPRELPPPTAQYTYTDQGGAPIVVVYRYDLAELGSNGKPKKEFRPFIVAEKRFAAPKDNRPLYNLPAIAAKPWIVFVEGEKAAEALIKAGVDATCAMSGCKAPIDKTDWSPLAGKHVVIWPDADEEGEEFAAKVRDQLAELATSVALVTVPGGKAKGWDAADAILEGIDFRAILNSAVQAKPKSALTFDLSDWDTLTAYAGPAPAQEWLISNAIPRRCAALLAAAGDTGKSFLALDLCLRVTGRASSGGIDLDPPIFGGQVQCHGAAVFITAEDGRGSVHRRLQALDPDGSRQKNRAYPLYVIALPDAGGPFAIVVDDRGRAVATPQLAELRERLKAIPDLALVVLDPLQCYVLADTNSDPQAAAFTMSLLNMIAAETNSTVLVTHHVRKEREAPKNAQEARHLIRGSSALVDQSRAAIVLWTPDEPDARKICKAMNAPFTPNAVVHGAVVKSNDGASRDKWTLIRGSNGMLRDVSSEMRARAQRPSELMADLIEAISRAANEGRPMTCSGVNGLYARRAELGEALGDLGKHRLTAMADELTKTGQIVVALANGTTVKWLDVPDGPFAMGSGEFAAGASMARAGRKGFTDAR